MLYPGNKFEIGDSVNMYSKSNQPDEIGGFDIKPGPFSGTAKYYAKYRQAYPSALLNKLLSKTNLDTFGTLLDLGAGPGRVAIPLASRFESVIAVDQEQDMIDIGILEASKNSVTNIRWVRSQAEILNLPDSSVDLITIGEALHRFDQDVVVDKIYGWLKPNSCVATLGCFGITSGTEPWQQILKNIVQNWAKKSNDRSLKSVDGSSDAQTKLRGFEWDKKLFQHVGFVDVEVCEHLIEKNWDIEEVIGNLYSTSVCSLSSLGSDHTGFEDDVRNALLEYSSQNKLYEVMRFGFTLARKPT